MRPLLAVLIVTLITRVIPLVVWPKRPCVRDECTYLDLAAEIWRGNGMVGTRGWLWAPGYPGLAALHQGIFDRLDAIKWTQVGAAVGTAYLLFRLTRAQFGTRAAVIAGMLFAINPTHIFYATAWLSEGLYTGLLFATLVSIGWARGETTDGVSRPERALVVGLLLGGCVLFRGIATYLLPCVALGLLWGRVRAPAAWVSVGLMTVAAVLVVAPYSAYATNKFDAFIVSDRTLGQMMWLGNNEFEPITFDFGNGLLREDDFDRVTRSGRAHCALVQRPADQDACELANGVAWIKENPGEFISRMPLRVSQMLTPHSLLTRTLRSGRWAGMPEWMDELLIVGVAGFSFVTLLGGTVGLFAKGKGWFAVTSAAVVAYHIAAIACLAGLSRYRVPLEPGTHHLDPLLAGYRLPHDFTNFIFGVWGGARRRCARVAAGPVREGAGHLGQVAVLRRTPSTPLAAPRRRLRATAAGVRRLRSGAGRLAVVAGGRVPASRYFSMPPVHVEQPPQPPRSFALAFGFRKVADNLKVKDITATPP